MAIQIQASSVEFTIDGETIDMSKAVVGIDWASGPDLSRTAVLGKIDGGAYRVEAAFEMERGAWDRLLAALGPSKPRWGQPGRRRRRKARFEARRHNQQLRRQQAEVWRRFEKLQRDHMHEVARLQIEREAQAIMALHGTPIRDLFRG